MFRGLRKKIGMFVLLVSFTLLLGMAGADDAAVASGEFAPLLPLVLKGFVFLAMMVVGAALIGGEQNDEQ